LIKKLYYQQSPLFEEGLKMFNLDEINSLTTAELLGAFERMHENEKIPVLLHRPEGYAWLIKDVLQERIEDEIESEKNIKTLEYLLTVAERLFRPDLCNIIKDKIEEIKKPPK